MQSVVIYDLAKSIDDQSDNHIQASDMSFHLPILGKEIIRLIDKDLND